MLHAAITHNFHIFRHGISENRTKHSRDIRYVKVNYDVFNDTKGQVTVTKKFTVTSVFFFHTKSTLHRQSLIIIVFCTRKYFNIFLEPGKISKLF